MPQGATTPGADAASTARPPAPARLVIAYRSRREAWTGVDTAAAWLVATHLLLLLVIVGRGAYYIDDLRAQGYALNQPFLEFILGSNATHFAPVPRTLDWLQSRLAPLDHTPAVAVTLLVRLILAIGFWRLLRRLFGARIRTLVPFALLLFTPALIPATTYYRQSITILACTAAMVWALDFFLRWVLYRRRSDLALLVVVTALGLGCYEKAVAIPLILLTATLTLFTTWSTWRCAPAVRAGLVAVAATTAVVAGFLVVYRSGPYEQGSASRLPSISDLLQLLTDTTVTSVLPLLLGGPYQWWYPAPYIGLPLVDRAVGLVCLLAIVVALALAARRRPGPAGRSGRGLLMLLAWLLPSVLIIAVGRFDQLGFLLVTAVRLWADLVPGFLIAGALIALPWQLGVYAEAPTPTPARPADAPTEVSLSALAGTLVLLLVLGGSLYNSFVYAGRWWDNPTGRWITNVRASLDNAEPYPRTLATPLPESVMPSWVSLRFPSDAPLLLLLRPDLRFHDGDGPAKVMDASGLRTDYSQEVITETDAPGLCAAGLPPGSGPVTVQLPESAPYRRGSQIELGLLLAEPTRVKVTVTSPDGTVRTPERFSDEVLTQGPHTLRVPTPFQRAVKTVTIQIDGSTTTTSCVVRVSVWAPT